MFSYKSNFDTLFDTLTYTKTFKIALKYPNIRNNFYKEKTA